MNQQVAGNAGPVTWNEVKGGFLHGRHRRHPDWLVVVFCWKDGTCVCAFFDERNQGWEQMGGRIINGELSADIPIPIDVIHAGTDKMEELKRAQ
jgi:hypothetical protein